MVTKYSLKNNFKNKAYNVQYKAYNVLVSFEILIYYFDSCQLIYDYKFIFITC